MFKKISLPSRSASITYLIFASIVSLFVITTVLWIAGGWQGLATIPLILANWLSVASLSGAFFLFFTRNDIQTHTS